MTDSAYTLDPRAIWRTDEPAHYEVPTADGTWTVYPDQHGRWYPYNPDGEEWPEQSGHDHQDYALAALLGEPQPLGEESVRLLAHAAAMGGWLSADYITGTPQTDWFTGETITSTLAEARIPAAAGLVEAGMWELTVTPDPACREIYRLIDLGAAKAAELKG